MTREERPEACLACGRRFRPRHSKAADFPNTVDHVGKGRCGPCRKALWRNGHARDQSNTKTTEENRQGVERWLASHWRPSKTVKVVKL